MKKLFILFIIIFYISCDTSPSNIDIEKFEIESKVKDFENLQIKGDTITAYINNNTIYYKDYKGDYYYAEITSGTHLVPVTQGYIVFTKILIVIVILFIFTLIIQSH